MLGARPSSQASAIWAGAWPSRVAVERRCSSLSTGLAWPQPEPSGKKGRHGAFGGTWTWDGSTWTKQAPATSPHARRFASMAYDAATGTVVLFGGFARLGFFGDTWTWGS